MLPLEEVQLQLYNQLVSNIRRLCERYIVLEVVKIEQDFLNLHSLSLILRKWCINVIRLKLIPLIERKI